MLTSPPSRFAVHGVTFVLWALAMASAVYWGFRLAVRSSAGPVAAAPARGPVMPDPAAIARLMGASPAQAAAAPAVNIASRFALAGVVARPSGTGVALISVDGKPAKPYRVGAPVEEGLVLQAVEPRRALLGPSAQGPASVTLELPVPKHDVRVEVPARAAPRVPAVPPQFQQPRLPVPLQRPGVMPQNQRPGMPSAAPR